MSQERIGMQGDRLQKGNRVVISNAKGDNGNAALNWLCWNYNEENLIDIVRLLIEKGANVNEKNNSGLVPQDLIRSCYKKDNMNEIMKILDGEMADV